MGLRLGFTGCFSQIIVAAHHPVDKRLANSGLPSVCVSYELRVVFLFYNSEKMERRLFCGMGE